MRVYIPMKDGEVLKEEVMKALMYNNLEVCPITTQGTEKYSELNRIGNLLRAIEQAGQRGDDLLIMDSDVILPYGIMDTVFDDEHNLNKDMITLASNRGNHILIYIKKRSVYKFKRFLKSITVDKGRDYCPLCEFFNTNENIMLTNPECVEVSKPINNFTYLRINVNNRNIPKIIHFCWFGKNKKSKLNERCIESWIEHCPDYDIIKWNEDNFDVNFDDISKCLYKKGNMARFSNYVRLCVLYKFGGIYLDTDMELLHNLDGFLKEKLFFGYQDKDNTIVNNSIIGSVKENPVILDIINNYTLGKCMFLGGLLISEVLKRKSKWDYKIFDYHFFSPMPWNNKEMPSKEETEEIYRNTSASYAFHWYEGTWINNPNTQKYWNKKLSQYNGFWRNDHYKYLIDLFPKDEKFSLIDIGCAVGDGCILLKKHFPKAELTGLDFSDVGIKKALLKSGDIKYGKESCKKSCKESKVFINKEIFISR